MDANCKNNKFNLDHVYCHSNDNNYISRTTKSNGGVDLMTLLKENKQLKAMLLLHLDLIQEQSDQLQAKDKLLATLKEENETLKIKVDKLEGEKTTSNKIGLTSVNESNNKFNMSVGGRNSYHRVHGKSVESTDFYKKANKISHNIKREDKKENLADYSNMEQQRKTMNANNIDKLSNPTTATITTRSRHTPTPPGGQIQVQNENKYKIIDENSNSSIPNTGSIIGQSNGKPISKIMLQLHRVKLPDNILPNKSNNNDDKSDSEISSFNMQLASIFDAKVDSPKSTLSSPTLMPPITRSPRWFRKTASPPNLLLTSPLSKKSKISKSFVDAKLEPSESPLSPLMDPKSEMEIKEEIKQDESDDGFSCGSSGPEIEPVRRFIRCKSRQSVGDPSTCSGQQFSETTLSNSSAQDSQQQNFSSISKNLNNNSKSLISFNNTLILNASNINRCTTAESGRKKVTYLTTCKMYSAREWTAEEGLPAEEFTSFKEEEEALKAEQPMLEIPKWSVKEVAHLYSIEGTEDLSDETFRKRHAKLEHDEKRRKKWDVQRIREQRTIERLKRRHCKDELIEPEIQEIVSFYPAPEQIKLIQISEELPVEAFGGELIPRLNPSEFQLPWRKHSHSNRLSDLSLSTNFEGQFENLQPSQKHHHISRFHNTTNENSGFVSSTTSTSGASNNTAINSSFLFLKKRKKPQSTNTRRQQLKNSNISTTIQNTSTLSFNLSTSPPAAVSRTNLFNNLTSPSQAIEEKKCSTSCDSNITEKVQQHSSIQKM